MIIKLITTLVALSAVFLPLTLAAPSCNATTSCGPRPRVTPCRNVYGTFDRLQCVLSATAEICVWQIFPCPQCNATTCGPRPTNQSFICPNGVTVARPSENCFFIVETGKCGYPIKPCPVCNATTCGRPPNPIRCPPNGTLVQPGPCAFQNDTKRCGYQAPKCPPLCNATSCGPRVDKVCPDGTVVRPGACSFNRDTFKCEFRYPKCPPVCNATTCGRPPNPRLCPDGITARVGPCRLNNDKTKCFFPINPCPRCKTTADCKGTDVYCSTDHFCRASATCSSNRDCIDPDNRYVTTAVIPLNCAVCTTCTKGFCGRECIPCKRVCRPNSNLTNCNACSRVKNCQRCVSTCV